MYIVSVWLSVDWCQNQLEYQIFSKASIRSQVFYNCFLEKFKHLFWMYLWNTYFGCTYGTLILDVLMGTYKKKAKK